MISQRMLIEFVVLLSLNLIAVGNVSATVVIDWVEVGDPGNLEHTVIREAGDMTSGYGRVDYTFRIGEYEVTNSQYAGFLNAVATTDTNDLYNRAMDYTVYGGIVRSGPSGSYTYATKLNMDNKPVNFVSWFDVARFTNWLHNGQPVGLQIATTTEDGAYTFTGPETVGPRNPGALYFLPNEHEWHKAAFYEPGAVTEDGDEWWWHATRSGDSNDLDPPPAALANETGDVSNPGPDVIVHSKKSNWNGSTLGNVVTVGSAGSQSYYGAKDMSGNLFEWVEADPNKPDPFGEGPYQVRGGSFFSGHGHLRSIDRNLGAKVGDGDTDGADFLLWQQEFSGSLISSFSDFDDDFDVDGDDLAIWEASYVVDTGGDGDIGGHSHNDPHKALGFRVAAAALSPAASLTVPEQASWLLFCWLIVVFLACRVKRTCSRSNVVGQGL